MAEKRRQHFLPQFYMRNFSVDLDRKRISLFVINSEQHVHEAILKNQAYENYFYGRSGVEDDLGKLEGTTSPIISTAILTNVLPERMSEGHAALLTFVLFQCDRTPSRAREVNESTEKNVRLIAKGFPDIQDDTDDISISDRDAPLIALRIAEELRHFAFDLRWKLLENKTGRLFITSDNPVIKYNQFLEKRNRFGCNTGLDCKGLQIFLPLGPRHLLMLYDGDVYRVGGRRQFDTHICVERESDVAVMNVLQAVNSDKVLYFSADTNIAHVREAVRLATIHRRIEKVEVKEFPAIGPSGEIGTLIRTSRIDLKIGLALDFSVIIPSVAGTPLNGHLTLMRKPELVNHFQETRMRKGPYDARKIVDSFRNGA